MTNSKYKVFKHEVRTADSNNPVWSAGYLWIDLTERQWKDIISALEENPVIKDTEVRGKEAYQLPSGLTVFKEQ